MPKHIRATEAAGHLRSYNAIMSYLTGRTCLVTGATRGIGRATAAALARMGAVVILHGRDQDLVHTVCGEVAASTGNSRVSGVVADFASLRDVRRLAREISRLHDRLDLLVNNVGIGAIRRETTIDGFERQFAVNHLAPFLLTKLLLELRQLRPAARIVNVSSMAHRSGTLDFDDLNWERRKYKGLQAYSDSKLANILFTRELARRLEGTGITANCLHPGVVATNIFSGMGWAGRLFGFVARPWLLSAEQGAETSVYLAASPEVARVSGKFFDKCEATEPAPAANDDAAAERLWTVSEELTQLHDRGV